ncbi:MAG TPA: cytochrome c biogenesis protein CcdA, partial [Terriglobales bacterium]|nr:cytochrome c biogenesis protein CcdA [Terriglobales bacterium]
IAGIVSFLSPCVLPLVPGYVSLISGTSVEDLQQKRERSLMGPVLLKSFAFILGFSVVFITLGAAATKLGQVTKSYHSILSIVAGAVIIIFGLHLTGLLQIKALYSDKRMHNVTGGKNVFGAFVVGFAFAFGWTPCIGPILAGILTLAAAQGTVSQGILLLAIYSLGLAVPFLLTSLGIERFLAFYARFRQHLHKVEVASGVLLIIIGLLIGFGKFTIFNQYFGFLNDFVIKLERLFT